ncbi:MAG: hypothetical protein HQ478_10460 [Chloroflexi bacterium]|nr:hypothetical protein [Chloroflexota bacterium]
MTNLIVAMILIGGIFVAAVLLSMSAFGPQAKVSESMKKIEQLTGEMSRTEIETITVNVTGAGDDVELTLRNNGQESLPVGKEWDVIISYDDSSTSTGLRVVHLGFTDAASPGSDEWVIEGIYLDAANSEPELFGRDVLDTGEELVINAKLASAISDSSTNTVAFATPNGVGVTAQFSN